MKKLRWFTIILGLILFFINASIASAAEINPVSALETDTNVDIEKNNNQQLDNTKSKNVNKNDDFSEEKKSQEVKNETQKKLDGTENQFDDPLSKKDNIKDQSNDPEEVTIKEYKRNVQDFHKVKMAEVKDLIHKHDNQDRIMYIGRPTCYYCRQFSPSLKEFNAIVRGKLLYFNIDAEKGAHDYAFEVIGIPGTPTTMRFINGKIVSAWIGGEKTGQELYNFLYSDLVNKLVQSLKETDVGTNDSNSAFVENDESIEEDLETSDISNQLKDSHQYVYLSSLQKGTMFLDAKNVASSTSNLKSVVSIDKQKKIYSKIYKSIPQKTSDQLLNNKEDYKIDQLLVKNRRRQLNKPILEKNNTKNIIIKYKDIKLPKTGNDNLWLTWVGITFLIISTLILFLDLNWEKKLWFR